jgi:hypothetical protein
MRLPPRLTAVLAVGAVVAGAAFAIVEAQPNPDTTPQTEQAPPSAPPPEAPPEAPPATVDAIPDAVPPPPTNGVSPEAKLEAPEPRIITPGEQPPALARTRAPYAIIEALDKVTAQSVRFVAPVGQAVRYENLIFTVRACEATTVETPFPEAAAYMEVVSQPRQRAGYGAPPTRQVFRGWMFASSPALHPLEHPVYDAWLIACSATVPRAAPAPATPRAPSA